MARVSVRAVGKRYRWYPGKWSHLLDWVTADRYGAHRSEWALRDISFDVGDGEAVGIIGMNGAGKSTLLKILAGTTQPTEGTIALTGRVAALLELGLGMHPDFSGWQNARLQCQLLGLDRSAIRECLPQVQAFAELGERMEQPVRTYSTGMQLRLAFSAATAVRPDVLIVDEVLAVGDAYFQHKCLRRIRSFQEQGMTLLLVTHDPSSLKALCRRALLLDEGRLLRDGPVQDIFDYYNAMIAQKTRGFEIEQIQAEPGRLMTRSGTREAEIVSVELCDAAGQTRRVFRVGETARIDYRIKINRPMATPTVGFLIRDRFGVDVFGTNTYHLGVEEEACAAGQHLKVTFELPLNLGCGHYSVAATVHTGPDHLHDNFDWWDQALTFQVTPHNGFSFVGLASLPTRAGISVLHD